MECMLGRRSIALEMILAIWNIATMAAVVALHAVIQDREGRSHLHRTGDRDPIHPKTPFGPIPPGGGLSAWWWSPAVGLAQRTLGWHSG